MGKIKKTLLMLLFCFAVIFNVFAQSETNSTVNNDETAIEVVNTDAADDYFSETNTNQDSNFKTPSTTWAYVKMIFFLLLVVAAIYGVMWFFKKKSNASDSEDTFLRKIGQVTLGPGKSVEVVSLVDRAFLLGVTDGSINLITEIEDKELVEAMNLNYDKTKNVKKPVNFAEVLDIFMSKNKKQKNIYGDVEAKVRDFSNKE